MRYPRILLILLLAGLLQTASAQSDQMYLSAQKDASGKYGFYDESNRCVIPHVFDGAGSFNTNQLATEVRFGDYYYLMDRAGRWVDGVRYKELSKMPESRARILYHKSEQRLTDLTGRQISPQGKQVTPIDDYNHRNDPNLFLLRSKGDRWVQLCDLSFRPISTVRATSFETEIYNPGIITFCTESGYGIMNANGKVLIPARYRSIDTGNAHWFNLSNRLQKDGFSDQLIREVIFCIALHGEYATIFEPSGRAITPPIKYKNRHKLLNSVYKKYLRPLFQTYGAYKQRYNEQINVPYTARRMEHDRLMRALPAQATGENLVKRFTYELEHPNMENYTLNSCLHRGLELFRQNKYDEAFPWLKYAAEKGETLAYGPLADCYSMQTCKYVDIKRSIPWRKLTIKHNLPSSRDYWFSCFMLGCVYENGEYAPRNYRTALHYFQLFQQHCTPLNRPLAAECVQRVSAKLNPRPNNPQPARPNHSAGRTNQAAGQVSHSAARPAYGQLPENVYMQSDQSSLTAIHLQFRRAGHQQLVHYNKDKATMTMLLIEENADSYTFCQANLGPGPGLAFNNVAWSPFYSGFRLVVQKDWSRVDLLQYHGGKLGSFNRHITKEEFLRGNQTSIQLTEQFEQMSGGGNGGGSSYTPANVQSGMSAAYYQDMYNQYARVAESAYNSLTAIGVSVTYDDGSHAGSTAGTWQGSRYTDMKNELRKAQNDMRRIRAEAARAGHHITPSSWETATVSQ
ncbi:MAG: SEL1-like repeat protein [Alistipes sp.]|nr:SEL1-like repeat protein [Alistipes sp.]